MKRNYIGLANSFHDSAVAVVDSRGEVVFAEATERSVQSKGALCMTPDLVHHSGEIVRSYCEPGAQIVTARCSTDPCVSNPQEILQPCCERRAALERLYGKLPEAVLHRLVATRHAALSMWTAHTLTGHNLDYELGRISWPHPFVAARRSYDHHLTHAAAACFGSPFDEALCAVVDDADEGAACAFFSYRHGEIKPIPRLGADTGNLGSFYKDVSLACGFGILTGEEWKVMGLAACGTRDEALVEFFRGLIKVNGLRLEFADDLDLKKVALYELRRQSQESKRVAADVAHAGQLVFTETLLALLENLSRKGDSQNLVLAGGCALNSSANGKIVGGTSFRRLHVASAPGDDGNAIGAALLAYRDDHPQFQPSIRIRSAYLGSRMSPETLVNVRRFAGRQLVTECADEAPKRAARLLSQGKVIGWIQGRAEFGPCALGNRSILADPRSPHIKDRINARVKFRDQFRPFATSILHELGPEYFEDYQESPYMERTLMFLPAVQKRLPGVVHVDGTGRVHSLRKERNPEFHELMQEFYRLTGVPLLLNTSFNLAGKPISHSVEDVLAMFFSSGLDAVFIDGFVIEK